MKQTMRRGLLLLSLATSILLFQNCSRVDFAGTDDFYRNQGLITDENGRPIPYYSNFKIGEESVQYPDLKMVFVLDNSQSMDASKIQFQKAFQNLFNAENRAILDNFNVTIYLITTSQLSDLNPIDPGSKADFAKLPVMKLEDIGKISFSSILSNHRKLDSNGAYLLSGKIPGDTVSYVLKTDNLSIGNTQQEVHNFVLSPLLGLHDQQGLTSVAVSLVKAPHQSPDGLIQDFNERIALLKWNDQNVLSGSYIDRVVSNESGLCGISRMLRHPEGYFKEGDLVSFAVFSDEEDSAGNESKCIDKLTVSNEKLYQLQCQQERTKFQYQPRKSECQVGLASKCEVKYTTTVPSSCKLNYRPWKKASCAYSYSEQRLVPRQCYVSYNEKFNFQIFGDETKTTIDLPKVALVENRYKVLFNSGVVVKNGTKVLLGDQSASCASAIIGNLGVSIDQEQKDIIFNLVSTQQLSCSKSVVELVTNYSGTASFADLEAARPSLPNLPLTKNIGLIPTKQICDPSLMSFLASKFSVAANISFSKCIISSFVPKTVDMASKGMGGGSQDNLAGCTNSCTNYVYPSMTNACSTNFVPDSYALVAHPTQTITTINGHDVGVNDCNGQVLQQSGYISWSLASSPAPVFTFTPAGYASATSVGTVNSVLSSDCEIKSNLADYTASIRNLCNGPASPSNCIDSKVSFTAESRSAVQTKTIYGLDSSACSVSSPDPQISNLCKNNIDGINGGTSCLTTSVSSVSYPRFTSSSSANSGQPYLGLTSAQCSKDAVDGSVKTLISTSCANDKSCISSAQFQRDGNTLDGVVQLTQPKFAIPGIPLNCQTACDFSNGLCSGSQTIGNFLRDNFGSRDCTEVADPLIEIKSGLLQSQVDAKSQNLGLFCSANYNFVQGSLVPATNGLSFGGSYSAPEYVTGVDSTNAAVDFNLYIKKQSELIFGNALKPVVSVFTLNSSMGDSIGYGLSEGFRYQTFANNFKIKQKPTGSKYSVLSSDYSLALKDLGEVIQRKLMRSAKIAFVDPRQQIRRVWITRAGQAEEELPNTLWGAAGSSLNISEDVPNLQIGDSVRVEFW